MDATDRYRELFELSPDAILIMEGDRFVDCNPAAVRMLRFPSREALLRQYSGWHRDALTAHPADLSPPLQPDGRESLEKAEEKLRITFERGTHTFEWAHTCADGEPILLEVQLTVVRRGEKPVLHCVWRDIGDRKRLEAELLRSQRLEAVGRLAGGVAHDFNNILMVIMANAEHLKRRVLSDRDETEDVDEIISAVDRAATLTQQLLSFSRGQSMQAKPTDLGELLSDLVSLLTRLLGGGIDVRLDFEEGPMTVLADPSQIEQLVVNLAANARDAMPDGGTLEIRLTHHDFLDPPDGLPAGAYVCLCVSDTGVGMSAVEIRHAFDPFFTTKPEGKGSGLGLATVHSVAEGNGGTAWIESELGKGTKVCVLLPRSELPTTQPAAKRLTPAAPGGTETILLVEDEAAIRELLRDALVDAGYTVISASDGKEALETLARLQAEVDLVVTDVVMPRMSGRELMENLSSTHPGLKVVYISGYSSERGSAAIPEEAPVLRKPFSPERLQGMVREVLGAPSSRR